MTQEDVAEIAAFEDGYNPTAKMLKYCQSTDYLDDVLTEMEKAKKVKKSGETVEEYIASNITRSNITTKYRTESKEDKFRAVAQNISEPSAKVAAEKILQIKEETKKKKEDNHI